MFPCDRCGECCWNLNLSPLYFSLDRGDGTCRYLLGNRCSIYNDRPLLGRVDVCYDAFFRGRMTLEEYCRLNQESCDRLKKQRRN
jgi:hypothetical protein